MNDKQEIIEAETIPSQAVAKREDSGLATISSLEQSFALAVRQRELLSDYIKKQLVPGKHFYQRGDQKPSLAKEGAEIILLPHNLAPDYEIVSGPEQPPDGDQPYQITVKCILRRKGDPGSFVGSGIGSAGSQHRNRDGKYLQRQPDKFLCHNATLKMAQKSAMIAATINSTAASEFFTQDMEEPHVPAPVATSKRTMIDPKLASEVKELSKKETENHKEATDKTREWFLSKIGTDVEHATQFAIDLGWIMPNESIGDIPLRFVPISTKQFESFKECLGVWVKDGKVGNPYLPNKFGNEAPESTKIPHGKPKEDDGSVDYVPPGEDSKPEAWRSFPMPFGKNAGVLLEDLEKNYLFGLWANYTVETEYKGKPKKPETVAKDQTFRAMLDLAGSHYNFQKKD